MSAHRRRECCRVFSIRKSDYTLGLIESTRDNDDNDDDDDKYNGEDVDVVVGFSLGLRYYASLTNI